MPTWFVDDPETFSPPPARSSARLMVLSETLSGEELTDMVGIPADERWDRGNRPLARGRFAGYRLGSRLPQSASVAEHLSDLLKRIEPAASRVRALVSDDRVTVRLWLGRHIANWNPGLSLSAEQLHLLDELGTGLGIDIYVDDAAEDTSADG